MINKDMQHLGEVRSAIRDLFEYGRQQRALHGEDSVFDFSLGNPSVAPPMEVGLSIARHSAEKGVHNYTSAPGDAVVRRRIADYVNATYGATLDPNLIYMTCGAAAALCISFRAMACPEDEFVIMAPYFPEYDVFVRAAMGRPVVVPMQEDCGLNLPALQAAITPHTKAVVINSPNNPSGAVYSASELEALAALLEARAASYGHPIYVISDEPYREIAYDVEVPYVPSLYRNTVVCYSYSKSLSLPGERIGYVAVNPAADDAAALYAAVCGAGRALGYVCAPSLLQRVVGDMQGQTSDLAVYRTNRDLLYNGLTQLGFTCIRPQGAFYLFVKAPIADSQAVSEQAKQYGLLLVPGDSFGAKGWLRVAYCVDTDMIRRSMPQFARLAAYYGLK